MVLPRGVLQLATIGCRPHWVSSQPYVTAVEPKQSKERHVNVGMYPYEGLRLQPRGYHASCRAQQGNATTSSSPAPGSSHAARVQQADGMPRSASSDPAAASSQAAELQQPDKSQSDLTEDTQQCQTGAKQASEGWTDQGRPDEDRQEGQEQAQEGVTDRGLVDEAPGDRGQIGQADNDAAMEAEQGGSARRRVTRASARQVALVLDMHHSGAPELW